MGVYAFGAQELKECSASMSGKWLAGGLLPELGFERFRSLKTGP